MARLADIVIDARHPASLARFWAAALDGYRVAAYDDDELRRLAAAGIADPEDDPTVLVEPSRAGPRLWLQQVLEPKTVKNRVHLDVMADDLDAEVQRLLALGATRAALHPTADLVVLHDPEGNEFCVVRS